MLGAITIGADSRFGANAVVVNSVPPNSVVVGVPGQIVTRSRQHLAGDAPDLNHTNLPDTLGVSVTSLLARVDELERQFERHHHEALRPLPHVQAPEAGTWHGEDFSI